MTSQKFSILPGEWAILKLPPNAPVPAWTLFPAAFISVTRTTDELSIVAPSSSIPIEISAERGWTLLQLKGPFAFDQTGILASIATPLAEAGVGIFALSTFDTDYLLVKTAQIQIALASLLAAGHTPT